MTIVLGFPITAPITCAYARLERLVPPAGLGAALHADGYPTAAGGSRNVLRVIMDVYLPGEG
jgi:hypothetical protein